MTEGQLFLPGLQPAKGWYFDERCCGSDEYRGGRGFVPVRDLRYDDNRLCGNKPTLLALYFRMTTTVQDGKDFIDDDTDRVYACSMDHLEAVIRELQEGDASWPEMPENPDLIVNARGEILKELHLNLARRFGVKLSDNWFAGKNYSNGRESLEMLWEREKGAFSGYFFVPK
jgi:hypothetical protein